MYLGGANNHRWHGARDSKDDPFDPMRGPLSGYLGDGNVKKCPEKVNFVKGMPWSWDYEDGCGGYGYNMTYIGSRIWIEGFSQNGYESTAKDSEIRSASEVLMFADTAMAKLSSAGRPYYLEYSFAEPPYFVSGGSVMLSWGYASPSIHFRHRDKANIGWSDGHVDSREMAEFYGINVYGVRSSDMMIGWLEPIDNSFFRP